MITCNFSGNFGNSLIQYAITRTIADWAGYEFGFNPKFNYDYHNGRNQLDFLDLDYGHIHSASFHENPNGITNEWHEKYETIIHENGDRVDWHPYQPDVFDIPDNTKLVVRCMQDARYYDREKLRTWIQIKQEKEEQYKECLKNNNIVLNDHTCIINVRGGEYLPLSNVLLQSKYWSDAIDFYLKANKRMQFIVITDDVQYAQKLFNFPVFHISIGCDYYILNNARNLILSNSSFAIMPVWLNNRNPCIIAPRYWARHNVSTGYWASSDMWTFQWYYLDRNGTVYVK